VSKTYVTVDGNEAAARIAHLTSEVVSIYPITPASPMAEWADAWSLAERTNLWGTVPQVMQLQSEAGAAGTLHGALQAGALGTTFTSSQGLLLMIPNMFKIAGELTPAVLHVAARTVATHALSIFGDHSDVMAARSTGWGMLCASSVQEAQDFALVALATTLASRVPFLHFFDGFRTSHEVNRIEQLEVDQVRDMIDESFVRAHRERALSPDRPVLRGSAQNPDVFFQAREAANPFYLETPRIFDEVLAQFAEVAGRTYRPFDYVGAPGADRVVVLMGSGCGAAEECVRRLVSEGEPIGMIKVRLYRPFSASALVAALPGTVRAIAVLDRTKEPGAVGEPLYEDVVTALHEEWPQGKAFPRVIGGRYGLSSKEFTPAMVRSVFEELRSPRPRKHFTVGIHDDVTRMSLAWEPEWSTEPPDVRRAVFFGLGSDGTVSANKNSVKILGEDAELWAQGYFVYDSKKSGATTVSHLRFGPRPIDSSYLIREASFVACHQFDLLFKLDVLGLAGKGATFLLNSRFDAASVWGELPLEVQQAIVDKKLRFYVVDADAVAREAQLGNRINTVLQTCFFALADVLPREEAIARIKESIEKSYGKRGEAVLRRNYAAVDAALAGMAEVKVPSKATSTRRLRPPVPEAAPDFVKRVTALMMEGKGDLLPVSALPVDGTFPTDTARWEKRSIAQEIPIWDPAVCIECALCALVCPHAAIRVKAYEPAALAGAPEGFQSRAWTQNDLPGHKLTVQVFPDDCTGCGVCVDVCPARSKEVAKHKAIDMMPKPDHLERERAGAAFFLSLPELARERVKHDTVKGSQLLEPLFEFSGACAGCGETPYIKLITQLFGDRLLVANATGCSSIYGGNLPTTPWSQNREGRGPAWSNSLFEDNAEFGLGMRLAVDQLKGYAEVLLRGLGGQIGDELVQAILAAKQDHEPEILEQRKRVAELRARLAGIDAPEAEWLADVSDSLVRKSVWIVGGDGWAYDIGFGGVDAALASGRDLNLLVLDTEVYSNTGGQASKATPRGAIAKFAAGGKLSGKKDLGMIAMAYGNVYVAQIAIGANPAQTVKALEEAEAWRGPSIVIAYSHCIAHGIQMSTAMTHQKEAVGTGYWPLWRYDPRLSDQGKHPFRLDSAKPRAPFKEFAMKEARFALLDMANPKQAERLMLLAQKDIDSRWAYYEQLAGLDRARPLSVEENGQ